MSLVQRHLRHAAQLPSRPAGAPATFSAAQTAALIGLLEDFALSMPLVPVAMRNVIGRMLVWPGFSSDALLLTVDALDEGAIAELLWGRADLAAQLVGLAELLRAEAPRRARS